MGDPEPEPAKVLLDSQLQEMLVNGVKLLVDGFNGFPPGSVRQEFACNAEDVGLIPGLGRSLEEGNSYPLQYSGLENSLEKSLGSQRVGHN